MNAKHTPGPWVVDLKPTRNEDHCGWCIMGAAYRPVCITYSMCTNDGDPSEEAQANARLIAASPMTLEALKIALSTLEDLNNKVSYETWKNLYEPVWQIRDAIAEAEGSP